MGYKFALLWGEAQLCLPYVTYSDTRVTFSDPKMTYSDPKVTYSDPKITYSDPKVTHSDLTHLPLPPLPHHTTG